METSYSCVILQVYSRLLGHLIIASPFDVVFMLPTTLIVAEVFNAFNEVFFFIIYNYRFRWEDMLSRQVILFWRGRLEQGYIEYQVYLYRIRQLKTVRVGRDFLYHSIRSEILLVKLFRCSLCLDISRIQPDFITRLVRQCREALLVRIFLLQGLSPDYFFVDEFCNIAHLVNYCVDLASLQDLMRRSFLVGGRLKAHLWVLAVAGHYQGYSSGLRDSIVCLKLSGRELLYLIVLLVVRIRAQDLFYRSIRVLRLTIYLRVIPSRETQVNLQLGAQLVMKCRDKLSAAVRDYRVREAIVTLDVAQEHAYYVSGLYLVIRDYVLVLRQAVNNDYNVPVPFRFWQVNNEVDRDVCPVSLRYRQRLQQAVVLLARGL